MKYAKTSLLVPGAKDFYSISGYRVDKLKKKVWVHITYYEHKEDGTVEMSDISHTIVDRIEDIIDPAWDENSSPPKPDGFDPKNPATWGALSWDDIPTVPDYSKLYATQVIDAAENPGINIESVIFDEIIHHGVLPDSDEWQIL